MAKPFTEQFPWVMWMDDDDEMLPGRLQLLDQIESHGQKAGVGDWIHSFSDGVRKETVRGDWSIACRCFSPCMTVVHGSLLPADGKYFHHAPDDVFEDLSTHRLMELSGVPWCYHRADPVHTYHRRDSSWSGTSARSTELLKKSQDYISKFRSGTNIQSFSTIALGDHAVSEAMLMLRSLRITGNEQSVYVLTNSAGKPHIDGLGLFGVHTIVDDDLDSKNAKFPNWSKHYSASNLVPGAMLSKMQIIRETLRFHPNTLFLDADQVVLRQIHDCIDANVGLVHEGPNSMAWPVPPTTWEQHMLGSYNGGYMFVSRGALDVVGWWEEDYLTHYGRCGDDTAPHGSFTDQSALDVFPTRTTVQAFHRGHSVSVYRLPRDTWPQIRDGGGFSEKTGIVGGNDLFFHGWPMTTIHQHFRGAFWNTHGRELFCHALSLSSHDHHRQILDLITSGAPTPDSPLPIRPRVRYIEMKVPTP